MLNHLTAISQFIIKSFLHIWPYLLITIPLAVAVRMSGAARYINRIFKARPIIAILLATIVGAFSPFCSCGVIPVIAALLMSGVPLAPVMSFWIASPSMDPEAFFLSVGIIGWDLAVWRFAATLAISLAAGLITHLLIQTGWIDNDYLKQNQEPSVRRKGEVVKYYWNRFKDHFSIASERRPIPETAQSTHQDTLLNRNEEKTEGRCPSEETFPHRLTSVSCGCSNNASTSVSGSSCPITAPPTSCGSGTTCSAPKEKFINKLLLESWKATVMVVKFMALAFLLEALITFYIPNEWIINLLGTDNKMAIISAALLGIPVYTSNLTALPMIGALLNQGMSPGAALAFLIAGPVTTLPAMAAVSGLVRVRIYALYLGYGLIGALITGMLYQLLT
jgi:uncharacterized membrane protein YraQ (UPF0718 family)